MEATCSGLGRTATPILCPFLHCVCWGEAIAKLDQGKKEGWGGMYLRSCCFLTIPSVFDSINSMGDLVNDFVV